MRLEGEAVRDALLAVSGQLNPKVGGPGVVLPEMSRAAGGSRPVPVTADAKEYTRRSMYLFAPQPPLPVPGSVRPARQQPELPEARTEHDRPAGAGPAESPEAMAAAKALAERLIEGSADRRPSASTGLTA